MLGLVIAVGFAWLNGLILSYLFGLGYLDTYWHLGFGLAQQMTSHRPSDRHHIRLPLGMAVFGHRRDEVPRHALPTRIDDEDA